MTITGLALHTVQDELRKLEAIGVIVSHSNGYHRFYRANQRHALFGHLRGIVQSSERLPAVTHAMLRRPTARRPRKKAMQRSRSTMKRQHPMSWNLFNQSKT